MLRRRTLVSTSCFVVLLLSSPLYAFAGEDCAAVERALKDMHSWLDCSPNGSGWRDFLRSDELLEQVALGSSADIHRVEEILKLYSSETCGLDCKRFASVRNALAVWHDQLAANAAKAAAGDLVVIRTITPPARTAQPEDLVAADFAEAEAGDLVVIRTLAPAAKTDDLTAAAQAARESFEPPPADLIERTESELRAALAKLDKRLSYGTQENFANWMKYLKRDTLDAQLDAADGPDLQQLRPVLQSYIANHEGLELAEFLEVRSALRAYMNAVLYQGRTNLKDDYQQQIDSLVERLDEIENEPTHDAFVGIGRSLGWLEAGGFAAGLVDTIRQRYWRSNLYAQLSEELIEAANEQDIDETSQINDSIMGTYVTGTAHLTGQIGVELVPNDARASFDLTLSGQAYSNNVGYNGPVTIYSNGVTHIDASKRIHLDVEGMTSELAQAWANVSSNINCIAARLALVRKIAWRRAMGSKGQAEAIASGRAAGRIAGRIDNQAATSLTDANSSLSKRIRDPLLRRDAFPKSVKFSTSDDHLFIRMLQVGAFQLAADSRPPELTQDSDLAVRLHESAVANFAESLIGGETLTDERVVEMLENAELEVPEELQVTEDSDPWSITFAGEQPLTMEFKDGEITVSVRGRRFTRGDQQVRRDIRITAKYRPDASEDPAKLYRLGPVKIEYVGRSRLSGAQVAMKVFLEKKFEAVFEEEITVPDLTLPGAWKKAGDLGLRQMESHTDWLILGWLRREQSPEVVGGG